MIGGVLPGLPGTAWGWPQMSGASPLGSLAGWGGWVGECGGEHPAALPSPSPSGAEILRDLSPQVLLEGAGLGKPGSGLIKSHASCRL